MIVIRLLLIATIWPLSLSYGQEPLLLTFSQGPVATGKVVSSRPEASSITLSVVDGQQVSLQNTRGSDYRVQTSPTSWSWIQVQQVAREGTSIVITPQLHGDEVTLDVNYSRWDGDESTAYTSTVGGSIGQWIQLLQSPNAGQTGGTTKVYSSGNSSAQLAVRVDRAVQ